LLLGKTEEANTFASNDVEVAAKIATLLAFRSAQYRVEGFTGNPPARFNTQDPTKCIVCMCIDSFILGNRCYGLQGYLIDASKIRKRAQVELGEYTLKKLESKYVERAETDFR
jgi:hypothetical protein